MSEPSPPERPRRKRIRRAALIVAVVAVLLPLVAAVVVLVGLQSARARQWVLGQIQAIAKESGVELKVEDFDALWGGRFILRNVEVRATPEARPVLTVRRVKVEMDLMSLRRPVRVIRVLELTGPRLDLTAPLPELPESDPQAPPGFEIRRLVLGKGSVSGPPPAASLSNHVRSWQVDRIEGGGSFEGGVWDVSVESSRARIERPGFAPLVLKVAVQAAYQDGQPVQIPRLQAVGDGLRLTASGKASLEDGGPVSVDYDVLAAPRLLAAGAPPGGSLRARGKVSLPESTATVAVAARDIPAEVLRPYVEPGLFRDLALAGTMAEARADLALGPGTLARVDGEGEAVWRRQDRELVRMAFEVEPGTGDAVRLTAEGDLLPGSPGRRHIQGTVTASGASVTAEQVRAEVRLPDLRAALAEIRRLWPRLVPAVPEGVPVQGSLDADVRLSGDLASPLARVAATWLPEPESRVKVQAEGRPATWSGSMKAQIESLSLAPLSRWSGREAGRGAGGEGFAGVLSGTVEISGTPRSYRTRLDAEVVQASHPPYLESLERAGIRADGDLSLRPVVYAGSLDLDGAGLFARPNASSTARLASFQAEADGTFRLDPVDFTGRVSFDGTGLDAPEMIRAERLSLDAEGPLTRLEGTARLDASGIEAAGATLVDLHAEARGEGGQVTIPALAGSLPEGRTFAASGRFTREPLLKEADLDLRLVRPVDPVREAHLTAILRNGVVELDAPGINTDAGPASVRATVPLGSLRQIPALAETLAKLPLETAPGPIAVQVRAPSVDSRTLLAALGMEPRPEQVRAGVEADLTFDPAAPAAGRGEVRVEGLTVETEEGRVAAESPVVARLDQGRLALQPLRLRVESGEIGATSIDVSGGADLDPSWNPWTPGDTPAASLVRNLSAEAGGTLDAALLNPFLEGGIGAGALAFTATASGTPDRLTARFGAEGPEASFLWPAEAVRIESPTLRGSLFGESWSASGDAVLNGGTVAFGARPDQGGALVSVVLEDVPYRLDYNLTTRVGGLLSLRVPLPFEEETRLRLDGTVEVERGVLVQDINLDREVFTLLLSDGDEPGTEETFAGRVDLDLNVTTREGILVRNNVADLRAHWSSLRVAGTAAAPEIRGRVDIDPGGLLEVYGQTVRIDRGTVAFVGAGDPVLDLATTSSLVDPTIGRLRGSQAPLAALEQEEEADVRADNPLADGAGPGLGDVLSTGLAGYYGERLAGSIGITRVSVRPVLVYGETDPSARLTVGGDFSRNASFAFSVDLRNSERRTWLLDLHGFRGFPGMTLEAFTTDLGGEGASLQQTLDFGGSREVVEEGPRLRRLEIEAPPGISRRALRRAITLSRREPVPREAPFEIEVDLAQLLCRRGYPDARVRAELVPVPDRPGRVDVRVTVPRLGPRVEIVFEGDRPPRSFRPEIEAAYRADFYEERSLEEMKTAAVRAFRSRGHLDPRVEIEVRRDGPPNGPRTVTVRSEAGPRSGLERLEIAGVAPEVGRLAAERFAGRLSRAELAAGLPGADRRLLEALRTLGHPGARIVGREVAGSRVVVRVEAGERRRFGRVEIAGVGAEERERLAKLLQARPGEPYRRDLAGQGALRLEDSLRARGYPDANVDMVLEEGPAEVDVRYAVTPGEQVRLAAVAFEGERWTDPEQLARVTGLEPGEPLDSSAVGEARSRLYRTGVFSRVTADVVRPADGEARVTFSLTESPRFHLGYGVRYESDEGTAAVVDAVDTNFLGRGLIFGMRGLYEPDDRSGRLFLSTGGLFGTGISLETYALARQRRIEDALGDLQEDVRESALQFSRPFGRQTTGRLYFRYRTTHLFEVEPDPFFPFDLEIDRPYMGAQVVYDRRNDKIDPTRGDFRSLDLSGSGGFLGSDFDYARLFGQVHLFRTVRIAGRPMVWAQSLQSGLARAYSGQGLISEERFRAGGEYSVRGYELESLRSGAIDPSEESLLVLNQELRFPLPFESLKGLVFFDAGQVWEGTGDFGRDLAKSLGFGLRAGTPIGLLRFDAAFPLDRREGDESYKLYFGFGNAF